MKRFSKQLLWFFLFLIAVFVVFFIFNLWKGKETRAELAYKSYLQGESAGTISERKEGFNKALELLLKLDQEYNPLFGNGKLYYDLGNTYFQLEEYPLAIFYYRRAESLMPRDGNVSYNLSVAQQKLDLPTSNSTDPFSSVFFFHTYLSLPERLQLFSFLVISLLVFYSIYIWYSSKILKGILIVIAVPALILLGSLGYSRYFSPINAVVVRSVDLRRDAGFQYAKIGEQPIAAGTDVRVQGTAAEGAWLKILVAPDSFGYVPKETLRVVNL